VLQHAQQQQQQQWSCVKTFAHNFAHFPHLQLANFAQKHPPSSAHFRPFTAAEQALGALDPDFEPKSPNDCATPEAVS